MHGKFKEQFPEPDKKKETDVKSPIPDGGLSRGRIRPTSEVEARARTKCND